MTISRALWRTVVLQVLAVCLLSPPAVAQDIECDDLQAPYFQALNVHSDFKVAIKRSQDEKKPIVFLFSAKNARRPGFQ